MMSEVAINDYYKPYRPKHTKSYEDTGQYKPVKKSTENRVMDKPLGDYITNRQSAGLSKGVFTIRTIISPRYLYNYAIHTYTAHNISIYYLYEKVYKVVG